MCQCRQVHFTRCDHVKKDWRHCRRYAAEARRLRYKLFPFIFALTCPSTTMYMGWQDPGLCGRCLSRQRIKDWLCCVGGEPEHAPLLESVVLPDGGGYPVANPPMVPENQRKMSDLSSSSRTSSLTMPQDQQKLSDISPLSRASSSTMRQDEQQLSGTLISGRSSSAIQGYNVYGEPKRYSWLELKPLPLVPGTAQAPTSTAEDSNASGKKASQDDVWPEGMSAEEYMEEVELLWQRASMQPARK